MNHYYLVPAFSQLKTRRRGQRRDPWPQGLWGASDHGAVELRRGPGAPVLRLRGANMGEHREHRIDAGNLVYLHMFFRFCWNLMSLKIGTRRLSPDLADVFWMGNEHSWHFTVVLLYFDQLSRHKLDFGNVLLVWLLMFFQQMLFGSGWGWNWNRTCMWNWRLSNSSKASTLLKTLIFFGNNDGIK